MSGKEIKESPNIFKSGRKDAWMTIFFMLNVIFFVGKKI